MSDAASSGIFVVEGAPAGAPIDMYRETVAAFIGPTPRGPADMPVAVRSVGEYLQRFGSPDKPSRLEQYLTRFFDNGGTLAVVVRVCATGRRNEIHLPTAAGDMILEALNPGPLEYLRAAVDYDHIPLDADGHFNLTIHRLAAASQRMVIEQEIFPAVSADCDAADFVGHALEQSALLRLREDGPGERPQVTLGSGASTGGDYVYADGMGVTPCSPSDYDLIGSISEVTGLYALDQLPRIDLLCIVPPEPGRSLGPVALFAAERYCRDRQALLLTEPPASWQLPGDVLSDQKRREFTSPNVVTCFPLPGDGSVLGALAGALVSRDAAGAVWSASNSEPLNLRCPWQSQLKLQDGDVAALIRAGVNPLTATSPGWIQFHGGVTLARGSGLSPEWGELRWRRTALFIVAGIVHKSRWMLFSDIDAEGAMELHDHVEKFFRGLHAAGALVGNGAGEAWFLRRPLITEGQVDLDFGLALRRPGEFDNYRLTRVDGVCKIRELGWQPALATAI
ncbi:MAG: hypothetical protein ACR2QB_12175 [Gammaproteobacteria bacterium]